MRNFISPIISERIPDFIKSDYPEMARFISDFYSFLEEQGNPLEVLETFFEKTEVNNEENGFIEKILLELGFDIDHILTIPKRELILHLREFYLNRGNEKSFKFLFRILFDTDIEIDYPRKRLFTLSNATYSNNFFIFTTATKKNTDEFNIILSNISSYSLQISGISSKINASIENIELVNFQNNFYFKIQIDSQYKNFIIQEGVIIFDQKTQARIRENIVDIIEFEIINGGYNYTIGDIIDVIGTNVSGISIVDNIDSRKHSKY